ncbi:hypothetical protein GCM10009854_10470 [Saccharopolyspora halophila]|uniref:Uncharacterized protein n=1 Tax=Saccharopolyspora halophila TaxID=405551 RepID=A0ABN3FS76_9PSEU
MAGVLAAIPDLRVPPVGDLAGIDAASKLGGYLGLLTAIVAWYASFAAVINTTFKRTVLPVFPLA